MADEQSIFDFLQPDQPETGLKGALGSGIRGLSDFFQQATPALLQDEDVGFGGAFAAGLLGGLGTQSSRQRGLEEQRRQEALKFLPNVFDQLDTGTQEQIAQTFLPGVTLRDQLSPTEQKLFADASTALRDPKVPVEDKRAFAKVITDLDPELADTIDETIAGIGVDPTPEKQFTFIQSLLGKFTADSVGEFEDTRFTDYSVLERKTTEDTDGLSPSQQFNQKAFEDFILIEQHKEVHGGTDQEAATALGISGSRFSNVARATGMSTAAGGVLSKGDIFRQALTQVMRNDFNLQLADLGTLSSEDADNVLKKAQVLFPVLVQGFEEAGIPITGGTPSPRSPAAADLAQQRVDKSRALTSRAEELRDAGDQRSLEAIMVELAGTGEFD